MLGKGLICCILTQLHHTVKFGFLPFTAKLGPGFRSDPGFEHELRAQVHPPNLPVRGFEEIGSITRGDCLVGCWKPGNS